MICAWLAAAAIAGFFSVAAGAVATHLASGNAQSAALLRTGALYGMAHAAALVGLAALAGRGERINLLLAICGWCFVVGIGLFSFSLFALALTGFTGFAAVTPIGGTALLVGWVALALGTVRRR